MDYLNKILAWIARNLKKEIALVAVVVCIALATMFAYDLAYNFIRKDENVAYDSDGEKVTLTIQKGAKCKEIAELLEKEGIIEDSMAFRLRAKLNGAENNFQYGTYAFVKNMPDTVVMEELQAGTKVEGTRITLVEGWSIAQMGAYLEEKEICLKEEFIEACNKTTYNFDYYEGLDDAGERRNLLEGYLFPETYDVIPQNGAEGVVKRLLRQFEKEFEPGWVTKAESMGYTVDEIVTIASIIEKEARNDDEERKNVASVIYNRLNSGMKLQIDATVLYAQGRDGESVDKVYNVDLEYDSPYNTYLYEGLPPGPICNPSRKAIIAALNPNTTEYLYYVLDSTTNQHFFTSSYDEFLAVKNGGSAG